MKTDLLPLILIFLSFSQTHSLFTDTPTRNYTISGYNNTSPILVLDGLATKYLILTRNPAHLQIHSIEGRMRCELNSTENFEKIIWPQNHSPILSLSGGIFSIIDQNSCQPTLTYNFREITNNSVEIIRQMSFFWNESRGILTVSGKNAVYQIDLNSSSLISSFNFQNANTSTIYQDTIYSKDFTHLYVLAQDLSDALYSVKVWQNNNPNRTNLPIKEINLPQDVFPGLMTNLKYSDQTLFWTLDAFGMTTTVYTFDSAGILNTKVIRPLGGVITVNDGNNFDVVAVIDVTSNTIEVIRVNDSLSLQNFTLPKVQKFLARQYQNRVLLMLDESGRVLTYEYKDDVLPPKPDINDGNSQTIWIIVVCILGAVLIIGAVGVIYICRKKLVQRKSSRYKELTQDV